ncbi:hypothetical protein Bca52824_023341 [Brassica carinata]|uniref:Uncharacterized protein n=1 Tax=Brassica carinata TaxID=52824 RepID=A0A8X8ASH5_BRACI|nr:hypothetical protein Bca52824_023341 [Brassica carinata]
MARASKSEVSSEAYSSEEEVQVNDQVKVEEDDEELQAVARSADDKREKARLREMQKMKKQNMNNKGKGGLKYLLQQTELFAYFAKSDPSASQKKGKGRCGELTEEEEDEEYLKEEDGAIPRSGGTRLLTQPACIQGKMRDYQLAGLNWLIRLYENGINGILADEMGLGKTLQTISLLAYLHEYRGINGPHMIVTPKSTIGNWMNEIRRFCPVLRAVKFLGNPEERRYIRDELLVAGKFDVCVTSFEMAIKDKTTLRRFSWRYIIIDEAHRIKNENSLLSKTMRLFNTNFRLLIIGTPLQVLRLFLLRRLKSDVEKGLPPKKETILKVGMSQMQKQYCKALLQKDLEVVNSGGERKHSTITDEDIDIIIAKGEEATAELDAKMKKFTEDAIQFKMDNNAELYDFDDDNKDENKFDFKKIVSENWSDPPKRERKRNYLLLSTQHSATVKCEYFKQTLRTGMIASSLTLDRLTEVYEKEVRHLMQIHQKTQMKDTVEADEPEEVGDPLTAEEGFSTWSKRDFNTFIRLSCEKYGRDDIRSIASEMEGKTEEELERYAQVFEERYELSDYDRIIKNIEKGEGRISRKDEIMKAIGKKLDCYRNPWLELKIQYGKLYNEECDSYMVCMVHKLGYGNWEELKTAFKTSPLFSFDGYVKSRSSQELARKCKTLIRLIEKENQEYDERERQARKQKKLAKNGTPSKRALGREAIESPTFLKKRTQLSMDDFVTSV